MIEETNHLEETKETLDRYRQTKQPLDRDRQTKQPLESTPKKSDKKQTNRCQPFDGDNMILHLTTTDHCLRAWRISVDLFRGKYKFTSLHSRLN